MQAYTVLVILTDGCIDDMRQTTDTLVQMSKLPISVVIVGVGSANFAAMEKLDGDDHVLRATNGQRAARDIVQFVPMRDFKRDPYGLTDATLAEIPGQMLQFAKSRKVPPHPVVEGKWRNPDPPLAQGSVEDSKSGVPLTQVGGLFPQTAPPAQPHYYPQQARPVQGVPVQQPTVVQVGAPGQPVWQAGQPVQPVYSATPQPQYVSQQPAVPVQPATVQPAYVQQPATYAPPATGQYQYGPYGGQPSAPAPVNNATPAYYQPPPPPA
uniref:Copine C-terminal domain-containing protein n=2 Tax=Lotharella globosa TaxID=91324 RepID=A0A7S3YYY7_9EUKA